VSRTLLLNATYEPLAVVPIRRAVVLVLARKAVVVEHGQGEMRSERERVPIPAVIRLTRYVKVPYRRAVPLTRNAILNRDRHRCAYCEGRASTVDHVVPRSRGGRHEWANVVAACSRCNNRKGDALLPELGWKLRRRPTEPMVTGWVIVGIGRLEPSWEPYLGGAPAERSPRTVVTTVSTDLVGGAGLAAATA
jgi:5-methylcytosine-specific restriction endonuclease McrA